MLDVVLADFDIHNVPTSRRRRPGETHARAVLREILREHGEDHLRLTLEAIRGSERNREELWSETIGAVSDVLHSCPSWKAGSVIFRKAVDQLDLKALREKAVGFRPWPVRGALRVLIWIELEEILWPDPGLGTGA